MIELHIEDIHNPPPPAHPSGDVTAFDEETGLPIVRRTTSFSTANEESNHEASPRESHRADKNHSPMEAQDVAHGDAAGRDVLHQSTDREELVRQAKDFARQFENGLKASTQGVKGAKVESVRKEKSPVRLDEKIEKEGQPVQTIPDILAGRIQADSHEAHEKVAKGIRDNFSVVRDEDQFKDGDPEFHYRAHKMQVQVTPQLSGEVHIVPKEVLEAGYDQHKDYVAARDADLEGDAKEEKQATAVARRINDSAMRAFEKRNAQTEYKFGSTQVNLPEDSDAHRAIRGAQAMVDNGDLMGDGKDIDRPHVTVRYGIQGDDTKGIQKFLVSHAPFTAALGKTIAFPPSPNSDGASVIVAPVESPALHRMNTAIEKHGDFKKSDFPDYKPHVTVAYVKPETAHKYVGMDVTAGKNFPVRSVAISSRDGEHTEIPLQGKMEAEGGDGQRTGTQPDGNSRFKRPDLSSPVVARDAGRSVPGDRPNDVRPANTRLAKGVTVLIGKDSHGIVRGGNPNFGAGGRWSVETPDGTKTLRGTELTAIAPPKPKDQPYIGVDFDSTLATFDGKWRGPNYTGKPVPEMVDRVKQWLDEGKDVRLFTARVAEDPKGIARAALEAWMYRNLGTVLPITHEKDRWLHELYDDRARQVEPNTGKVVEA